MAAEHNVLIPSRGVEASNPLHIPFDAGTGVANGMSGQVDSLGVTKMAQLVIKSQA